MPNLMGSVIVRGLAIRIFSGFGCNIMADFVSC